MATAEQLQLDIVTKFDGVGINQIRKQLMNMKRESEQLKQALTGVRKRFRDINATVNKDQVAEALKRARVEAKRFKGEYLSILFFGMAIQRVFGGFLTAAFQTFSKVTEGTKAANSQVGRLTAAWEFFKYSLINALLNNPMFQSFLEWIIGIVDWFNALGDDKKGIIGGVIIGLTAIGALMTGLGTIALGVIGVEQVLGEMGSLKYNVTSLLAGIGLISLSVYMGKKAFEEIENGNFFTALLDALQAGALGFAGIRALKGGKYGAALVLAIGIELFKQDMLWSLFKGVMSPIVAGIVTIFETAWHMVITRSITAAKEAFANFLMSLSNSLSGIPYFKKLAFDLAAKSIALRAEVDAKEAFSVLDTFKKHTQGVNDMLSQLDGSMEGFVDKMDSIASFAIEGGAIPRIRSNVIPEKFSEGTTQNIVIENMSVETTSVETFTKDMSRLGFGEYVS